MIIGTLLIALAAGPLLTVSDGQGGVAGVNVRRTVVHRDGTWSVSLTFPNGNVVDRGRGDMSGADRDALVAAIRALDIKGDESCGTEPPINERRVVIEVPGGRLDIRGVSPNRGGPLASALDDMGLGRRAVDASRMVAVLERIIGGRE